MPTTNDPGPGVGTERTNPPTAVAIATTVLLGAVLRLVALGRQSLWLDEAFSIALARTPWPSFVQQLRTREANMALYYLVLRVWLHLGMSEWVVRLLSVLAGVATIPIVYAIGARLFGRRTGLAAALILAVDPFHVALSQDARSYPLAILLAACSCWAFIHLVAAPGPVSDVVPEIHSAARRVMMWQICYVVTGAAAVYAHFYAAFVLIAQCVSLGARRNGQVPWKRLVACWAIVGVLLLPLVAFVLSKPHGNIDWLAAAVPHVLSHLLELLGTPIGILGLAYVAVLLTMAWAAVGIVRRSDRSRHRWSYALVTLWLATPVVIPVVLSLITKPVFDPRYAAVSIPAIALLGGAIVDQLPTRRASIATFAAILTIEGVGDATYFARFKKEDWRDATHTVLAASQPGDVVVFYAPYVRRPYDYYADRSRGVTNKPRILYPSASYATLRPASGVALSLPEAITRAQQVAPRVWLILSHVGSDTDCTRTLSALLRTTHHAVETFTFQGIDVSLYSDRNLDAGRVGLAADAGAAAVEIAKSCPHV